jgi:DNA-binding NarL/FixJ family response regulator
VTNSEWAILIENALRGIPADARDNYRGQAWLKLQQVQGRSHDEQERAVTRHIEYQYRKDRQQVTSELSPTIADPRTPDPATLAELRDEVAHELARLDPIDRSIVAMIAAGHNHREIGAEVNLAPSTIVKRLQRIRESRTAGGRQ